MKIYLAGGMTGNLAPMWSRVYSVIVGGGIPNLEKEVKRFVGEDISIWERNMDIPHSNTRGGVPNDESIHSKSSYSMDMGGCFAQETMESFPNWKPYILESFYYADQDQIEKLMPYFGDFMLDSGAFTFMQNKGTHVEWEDYLERYADFIKRNKVEKFFELDIDSVIGYDRVLTMRSKLERMTGKQCIPVWHISRGKDDFLRMCDEYGYVAIGGLVGKASRSKKQKRLEELFYWFIGEAHKRGAKIHGLGYTSLEGMKRYHFDSVDSTSWTSGNRFGHVYKFDGRTMVKYDKPDGTRMPADRSRALAMSNFIEWCKFQKWAETHINLWYAITHIKNYGGKNEYRITGY